MVCNSALGLAVASFVEHAAAAENRIDAFKYIYIFHLGNPRENS